MDNKKKEELSRRVNSIFKLNEERDKAAKKRKEKAASATPTDKDPGKANYKKNKFVNSVKTITHRIFTGMVVTFKDGRVANYNLGKIDTILVKTGNSNYAGMLLCKSFISCIKRAFKDKVNDFEKDVVFKYTDEERAKSVMGSGFYDRK